MPQVANTTTSTAAVPQPSPPPVAASVNSAPVVIVGTGPVGIRVAEELLRRAPHTALAMFGNEPWEPYDRVRLSSLLAGDLDLQALANTLRVPDHAQVSQHHNCAVVGIDRDQRTITDAQGLTHAYSKLVLATGSSPHIPNIPGIDLPGVFTFRDLNDAQRLSARRVRSRHTVVLGGGLLGLEAARAMQLQNTQVTVVEHGVRLMGQQLDGEASELLREHVIGLGVRVILEDGVKAVIGDRTVNGLRLHSGRILNCDTVVLATGIRPNTELALHSGLSIGRGIRVNDQMQTTDPDIFAVGECAEHRDRVYGLVAPGLEQAAVAAHSILGGTSSYTGSIIAARLKVVERPVLSIGDVADDQRGTLDIVAAYRNHAHNIYRKLVLRRGRLVAAVAVGDCPEGIRIQESITNRRRIWPWQLARFRRTGRLWAEEAARNVSLWPAAATVCNCAGISRGELTEAMIDGCTTVKALACRTRASTVCGSCKPLLAELVGESAIQEPDRQRRPLLGVSVLALALSLLVLLAMPIPYSNTVQQGWHIDELWRSGLWKQTSGYTLLGLSVLGLIVSLRKRWRRFTFGDFTVWRLAHAAVGLLAVLALMAHTGFRLGDNLNMYLMLTFLGLAIAGAGAGAVVAMEQRIGGRLGKRLRSWWNWAHIALLWPVPTLLGFHILKTYYF